MKIISKHKDYYDNALSYGVDKTQVYVRKEQFTETTAPNEFETYYGSFGCFYTINKREPGVSVVDYPVLIGFCGNVYAGCCIRVERENVLLEEEFFYSRTQIHAYLDKLKSRFRIEFEFSHFLFPVITTDKTVTTDKVVDRIMKKLDGLSEQFRSREFENWFFEFDTPVFVYPAKNYSPEKYQKHYGDNHYNYRDHLEIVLHPVLKNLGFYRVKDAFECFQEISQFKFGVLTNNYDPSNERTDREKFDSHGFDNKYGFRTRPKKK